MPDNPYRTAPTIEHTVRLTSTINAQRYRHNCLVLSEQVSKLAARTGKVATAARVTIEHVVDAPQVVVLKDAAWELVQIQKRLTDLAATLTGAAVQGIPERSDGR